VTDPATSSPQRIVVVMPNWLGDAVMATPFLRLLRRRLCPAAHIAALANPLVAPALAGLEFVDATRVATRRDKAATLAWMRAGKFDMAILLPNSFRSAWMAWRAGIPRRIGYAREYRGWMLTDKLRPEMKSPAQRQADRAKRAAILTLRHGPPGDLPRIDGFEPVPTIDYYLGLVPLLGAPDASRGNWSTALDRRMELGITDDERSQAAAALLLCAIPDGRPLVVLVPGANFGSGKCWMPDRFAEVALRLIDPAGPYDATVLLASSPAELPIVNAIMEHATAKAGNAIGQDRLVALAALNNGGGVPLGALKEIVRRSRLMICNDTGPRHFAAAFGVPTITLFGPTDPRWAETFSTIERQIRVDVPCGPCQLKRCPLDHRCMTGITAGMVLKEIESLWFAGASAGLPSPTTQDTP